MSNKPPPAETPRFYARSYRRPDGVLRLTNKPTHEQPYYWDGYLTIPIPNLPSVNPAKSYNKEKAEYTALIDAAALAVGLDPSLVKAVIQVESGYNPEAVSPKGAVGLMQLMPATAARYGVTNATEPMANIQGGTRYLADLLKLFDNDLSLALAAYNAGENAVLRYGKKIPPFSETQNYVKKILAIYRQ